MIRDGSIGLRKSRQILDCNVLVGLVDRVVEKPQLDHFATQRGDETTVRGASAGVEFRCLFKHLADAMDDRLAQHASWRLKGNGTHSPVQFSICQPAAAEHLLDPLIKVLFRRGRQIGRAHV